MCCQDGVPAPALARICRYATERTAGQTRVDAAHPPFLNPTPRAVVSRGKSQSAVGCDHGSDASDNSGSDDNVGNSSNSSGSSSSSNNMDTTRSNIMCQKGSFRGTVFFIVEGDGKVVVDVHDEPVGFRRGRGGDGGGSSTESLLAAAAFGNRRARKTKRKRRCSDKGDESNNERPADDPVISSTHEGADAVVVEPEPASGVAIVPATDAEHKGVGIIADDQRRSAAAENRPTASVLDDVHERAQRHPPQVPLPSAAASSLSISVADREYEDWGSGGGGEKGCCLTLAALKRGDFFGVDPASPNAAASSEPVSSAERRNSPVSVVKHPWGLGLINPDPGSLSKL